MKWAYVASGVIGAIAVVAVTATAGIKMAADEEDALECRDVVVEIRESAKDPDQVTGTIAGAVIGGAIGSQIGDGSGQDVATAAGAVAGGVAGKKVQEDMQENNVRQEIRRVCE